jgi:hypothetical protein
MAGETGISASSPFGGRDFFAQTRLDLGTCATLEESDAALGALLLRYLRHMYDERQGAWPGRDGRDTLRLTCHAAEVLHQLNFDNNTAEMVYKAGNWLINLDIAYLLPPLERAQVRLYPSRFKTLAYLGRFDDEQVRHDFIELLGHETDGLIGDPLGQIEAPAREDDSVVLRTCISFDTLLTLEQRGWRRELCGDERYAAMVEALREQLRGWQPKGGAKPAHAQRNGHARPSSTDASAVPLSSQLTTHRDLSYVLGLMRHLPRRGFTARQTEPVVVELLRGVVERDRARFADLPNVVYPALQLAVHFREDKRVEGAIRDLLDDLRAAYGEAETPRRWELTNHTLIMRLLLAFYTPASLARGMAARLLTDAERYEKITLESDLQTVIRERITIELGNIRSLSGGFTDDQILHVPFTYWFPTEGHDGERRTAPPSAPEASLIIKRSTSNAFHTATANYGRLPTELHPLFLRQPARSEVYKSAHSPAYYLPMEDLTNLVTFRDFLDDLDQRAMAPQQIQLLRAATEGIAEASFALFRETRAVHTGFPSTQIARLYLSRIESSLVRAISRIPWLKTALDGYSVSGQRFRGLEYYLGVVTRQAHALQPASLGLVHGDFHARNIMLDRAATHIKLIDLDKLSWTGDYAADLGNLLVDVTIYRRLVEPGRGFGLPPEQITFVASQHAEKGTAENAIEYPALGRPATVDLQTQLLQRTSTFAAEVGDGTWKSRLWLAAATALLFRIGHHTEREIAAVLYGEAIRLLHELARALEGGQALPTLPVPDAWPTPASRVATRQELPDWLARHEALRKIHEGLRAFGLRAEVDRSTLRYTAARSVDGPVVVLVQGRREGIARMLLRPIVKRRLPPTTLEVIPSSGPDDEIVTYAVILTRDVEPQEALKLVRSGLGRS